MSNDPAERAAERVCEFLQCQSVRMKVADIIRAELTAAVEAAREECARQCEIVMSSPLQPIEPCTEELIAQRIRALNLSGALDRKVNEARLAEAEWWKDEGQFSQWGSERGDKRIAELKAALGEPK